MGGYASVGERLTDEIHNIPLHELINKFVPSIEIKKAGKNYVALCPFHKEKTPSLSISDTKGSYHCFGCGVGGDAITFLEEYYHIEFYEAESMICDKYGISFISDPKQEENIRIRNEVIKINEAACHFFKDKLQNSPAQDYLLKRINEDTIKEWNLGYAPQNRYRLGDYLTNCTINMGVFLESGLLKESDYREEELYSFFSHKIIIPIKDQQGKIVGFAGRAIGDEKPKYINISSSKAYNKSDILFGIDKAYNAIRESGEAIVVEGYFDVIKLSQEGIENCICPGGTSLTEQHLERISGIPSKQRDKKIIMCFDGDDGGKRNAERIGKEALKFGYNLYFKSLPEGMDPDDYLKKHTKKEFLNIPNKELLDFILELEGINKDANEGLIIQKVDKKIYPLIDISKSPLQKRLWLTKLTNKLGLSGLEIVLRDYKNHLNTLNVGNDEDTFNVEELFLYMLTLYPAYRGKVRKKILKEHFSKDSYFKYFDFISDRKKTDHILLNPGQKINEGTLFEENDRVNILSEFEKHCRNKKGYEEISRIFFINFPETYTPAFALSLMKKEMLVKELDELKERIENGNSNLIDDYNKTYRKYFSLNRRIKKETIKGEIKSLEEQLNKAKTTKEKNKINKNIGAKIRQLNSVI